MSIKRKNRKARKRVFLIVALSLLMVSCIPHKTAEAPEETRTTGPEVQAPEEAAGKADNKEPYAEAPAQEPRDHTEEEPKIFREEETIGEQSEKEALPDSAVYDTEEKAPDNGRPDTDQREGSGSRHSDEGEIVIPSS